MIRLRRADDRGRTQLAWLDGRHSFSFGQYFDPEFMGFGPLRVLNDDRIAPGGGFGTHPHRDMEIVTVVLKGALEHKDSMGNSSVIRAGDVQRMSAGTGIQHSEFNHSGTEPVHLLQIWIEPERKGIEPSYEQRSFPAAERSGSLRLAASHDGRQASLRIHRPVDLHLAALGPGEEVEHELRPGRRAWVQVATGAAKVNDHDLGPGDGAAIDGETRVRLTGVEEAEILLFDLG
ncbi:MAG: pirin family protein [Planctomycetota bacterium]|jgi:redox-sensitive bicupin YhaK (pirin superfamily)